MIPIIDKKDGKFYFDYNQTNANAILNGLKTIDQTRLYDVRG